LDKVEAVMTVLTDMREAVERKFHQLFTEITDTHVASTLGFTVSTPRTVAISRFRSNAAAVQHLLQTTMLRTTTVSMRSFRP